MSLLPAVLMCILLAACAQTPLNLPPQSMLACDYRALESNNRPRGPALVSDAYGSVTDIPLDAVLVHDPTLFRSVIAQSLYSQSTPTGTTMVTARFANCTNRPIQFRARTSFLDNSRTPTEPVSTWTTLFLDAGALTVYQERSMNRTGVDYFLIEIGNAD